MRLDLAVVIPSLLLAALAGCTSPSNLEAVPATSALPGLAVDAEKPAAPAPGDAPTWSVGDWWTYKVDYANSGESNPLTIVVYKQDGENWYLAGDDHKGNERAEFSHYPTLGPWTKSDFQPMIHAVKIPFFRFPLADGKTWTDTYRGAPAAWKATQKGGAYELEMASGGQSVKYGYSNKVGWFTHLEFGFGSPNTAMTLLSSGHNHTSAVPVLAFTEHVHGSFTVLHADPNTQPPGTDSPATSFTVAGDKALLWGFFYGGAPGSYAFALGPQDGAASEGVEDHQQTSDATARFHWGEFARPTPGTWGLLAGGASQGFGFVFAEALEVQETMVTPVLG